MPSDYSASALAAGDSVRIVAARTTTMVANAQDRHGCSPTVTAALGRLLTGAALMGTFLKGRERITLQINGDGPVRALVADVRTGGRVRGYPLRPRAELPLNASGKFDVGGIVGRGFLHVTRTFDTGLPYTSAVPLATGEIGDDLAEYFAHSEQVPSVVGVGVLANPQGVIAAGGFLAHLLPGADETTVSALEDNVAGLPHVSALVREGASPEEIVALVAGRLGVRVSHLAAISFTCSCNRERVSKVLVGLGPAELDQMANAQNETEVTCDFCGQRYYFSPQEIRELRASASDTGTGPR
ncbi:MAG TPA: Hsp33 family molecular chaperone HslO [Candidatus Eremiobacteraceae bacterium]|nr:Hsp33 family molecular chaperone HslO [Candidatus Eremiobacteraceae bacterium]